MDPRKCAPGRWGNPTYFSLAPKGFLFTAVNNPTTDYTPPSTPASRLTNPIDINALQVRDNSTKLAGQYYDSWVGRYVDGAPTEQLSWIGNAVYHRGKKLTNTPEACHGAAFTYYDYYGTGTPVDCLVVINSGANGTLLVNAYAVEVWIIARDLLPTTDSGLWVSAKADKPALPNGQYWVPRQSWAFSGDGTQAACVFTDRRVDYSHTNYVFKISNVFSPAITKVDPTLLTDFDYAFTSQFVYQNNSLNIYDEQTLTQGTVTATPTQMPYRVEYDGSTLLQCDIRHEIVNFDRSMTETFYKVYTPATSYEDGYFTTETVVSFEAKDTLVMPDGTIIPLTELKAEYTVLQHMEFSGQVASYGLDNIYLYESTTTPGASMGGYCVTGRQSAPVLDLRNSVAIAPYVTVKQRWESPISGGPGTWQQDLYEYRAYDKGCVIYRNGSKTDTVDTSTAEFTVYHFGPYQASVYPLWLSPYSVIYWHTMQYSHPTEPTTFGAINYLHQRSTEGAEVISYTQEASTMSLGVWSPYVRANVYYSVSSNGNAVASYCKGANMYGYYDVMPMQNDFMVKNGTSYLVYAVESYVSLPYANTLMNGLAAIR